MFYSVRDVTVYEYDDPVRELVAEVRKKPRDHPGQRCMHFEIELGYDARIDSYRDHLGNEVFHFNIPQAIPSLTVEVQSMVEMIEREVRPGDGDWEDLEQVTELYDCYEMLLSSPDVSLVQSRRLAPTLDIPRASGPRGHLTALTALLRERSAPDSDLADFEQAFESSRLSPVQVTHLGIGLCRLAGIPARFVRGYLFGNVGDFRTGSDHPHCWLEACVSPFGWEGFDPTNGVQVGDHHIAVAVGRDALDVEPIKSVYLGTSDCQIRRVVKVYRAEERLDERSLEGLLRSADQ